MNRQKKPEEVNLRKIEVITGNWRAFKTENIFADEIQWIELFGEERRKILEVRERGFHQIELAPIPKPCTLMDAWEKLH